MSWNVYWYTDKYPKLRVKITGIESQEMLGSVLGNLALVFGVAPGEEEHMFVEEKQDEPRPDVQQQ